MVNYEQRMATNFDPRLTKMVASVIPISHRMLQLKHVVQILNIFIQKCPHFYTKMSIKNVHICIKKALGWTEVGVKLELIFSYIYKQFENCPAN